MRHLSLIRPLLVFSFSFIMVMLVLKQFPADDRQQTINPIIGDASFIETYGISPGAYTDEDIRIKTHLAYVEKMLRSQINTVNPLLLQKRLQLLNHLKAYYEAGIFPRNYDHSDQRKPCFVDRDGNICAVGYLVEQTMGRDAAERINQKFQYAEIREMNDPILMNWVEQSGLTLKEIAMIQPKYTPINYSLITPEYAIGSSMLGGVNLAMFSIEANALKGKTPTKSISTIALISGAATTTLGLINLDYSSKIAWGPALKINTGQQTLSMLNIGLGSASMFMSIYKLAFDKKMQHQNTAWNIFSTPVNQTQQAFGLSFAHRF